MAKRKDYKYRRYFKFDEIAKAFNYKSPQSFRTSAKRKSVENGVEYIVAKMTTELEKENQEFKNKVLDAVKQA